MLRSRRGVGFALAGVLLVAGCSASADPGPSGTPGRSGPNAGAVATSAGTPSELSGRSSSSAPSNGSSTTDGSSPDSSSHGQLPRGGTHIIGHYRVVAYYGAPEDGGALGVLGRGSPEHAAQGVIAKAQDWAGYGLPVQPAMELIATVAQNSPGPDGDYSSPVPMVEIKKYLAVAHRHKMLLVLDLQPGRASFLSQAKRLHDVLLDPSVSLGLDPEWKVDSGAPGGGRIGSSSASGVNEVTDYVSHLVRSHHLPDKLLVVHQFTTSMLRNRDDIHERPGVEVTFHADGFGGRGVKRGVFRGLHFPGHPFGTGFKLFLTQDIRIMGPKQVMKLSPRPDVITYQ